MGSGAAPQWRLGGQHPNNIFGEERREKGNLEGNEKREGKEREGRDREEGERGRNGRWRKRGRWRGKREMGDRKSVV